MHAYWFVSHKKLKFDNEKLYELIILKFSAKKSLYIYIKTDWVDKIVEYLGTLSITPEKISERFLNIPDETKITILRGGAGNRTRKAKKISIRKLKKRLSKKSKTPLAGGNLYNIMMILISCVIMLFISSSYSDSEVDLNKLRDVATRAISEQIVEESGTQGIVINKPPINITFHKKKPIIAELHMPRILDKIREGLNTKEVKEAAEGLHSNFLVDAYVINDGEVKINNKGFFRGANILQDSVLQQIYEEYVPMLRETFGPEIIGKHHVFTIQVQYIEPTRIFGIFPATPYLHIDKLRAEEAQILGFDGKDEMNKNTKLRDTIVAQSPRLAADMYSRDKIGEITLHAEEIVALGYVVADKRQEVDETVNNIKLNQLMRLFLVDEHGESTIEQIKPKTLMVARQIIPDATVAVAHEAFLRFIKQKVKVIDGEEKILEQKVADSDSARFMFRLTFNNLAKSGKGGT